MTRQQLVDSLALIQQKFLALAPWIIAIYEEKTKSISGRMANMSIGTGRSTAMTTSLLTTVSVTIGGISTFVSMAKLPWSKFWAQIE